MSVFHDHVARVIAASRSSWWFAALFVIAPAATAQVLTVKEIRAKNQANMSVTVRGVITAADVVRFYVQDDTGAIGVIRAKIFQPLNAGDLVEISGTTTGLGAGLGMNGLAMKKIGSAPLPKPETLPPARLQSGGAKHQRVKVSGTIHEIGIASQMHVAQVASGGVSFVAIWPGEKEGAQAAHTELLDAIVDIEGAAVPEFSSAGYMNGFRLLLAESSHVKVRQPGSADPFSRPKRALKSLLNVSGSDSERFVVRGVVSFWSDAGWFFLQDDTSPARVDNAGFMSQGIGWLYRPGRSEPPLKPGDIVEIVGQPLPNRSAFPALRRCEWRVVGNGAPPASEAVSASEVIEGSYEGRAISIHGRVVDARVQTDYLGFAVHTFWLEAGNAGFTAIVQKRKAAALPAKAGDHVRIAGVVSAQPPAAGGGPTFRVNVNDFSDIQIVPPPPAWQSARVLRWVAVAGGVALLAAGWIVILRRQVAAQTAQLRENALQLQQQLTHEKELSEMKSRFVFTVSHEFRNPLAIIMSCSDVLQRLRDRLPPEQHQRQIEGIQQSVRRMADMMEEVLLLGRADAGQLQCSPEETDLPAFCQKLADQTQSATAGRCRVQLERDGPLEPAAVDRSLLQHILTNLLSNAVKYSPAGSPVMLRLSQDEAASVFAVTDHGPGIPPQDQAHLFEPFHRGANVGGTPGTGLGLAIVKHCVEAHGGFIACETGEGGTTFTVRLPRSAQPAPRLRPAAEDTPAIPQPA